MASTIETKIEAYRNVRDVYCEFTLFLENFLSKLLNQEEIQYVDLQYRTKSIDSFEDKIHRKNHPRNPLTKFTDLSGSRIILYYPEDIKDVEDLIRENFIIDWENTVNKKEQLPENTFGYSGIHYIVLIPYSIRKENPDLDKYKSMKHEIQIHTLCQYAWSTIQRKIEYKSEELISPILSRKLARLCALLELADDEFQRIQQEELSELADYDLSTMSLQVYIRNSKTMKNICKKAWKNGILKMTSYEDKRSIEELIRTCSTNDIKKIRHLDTFLSSEHISDTYFQGMLDRHGNFRAGPLTLILLLLQEHMRAHDS